MGEQWFGCDQCGTDCGDKGWFHYSCLDTTLQTDFDASLICGDRWFCHSCKVTDRPASSPCYVCLEIIDAETEDDFAPCSSCSALHHLFCLLEREQTLFHRAMIYEGTWLCNTCNEE